MDVDLLLLESNLYCFFSTFVYLPYNSCQGQMIIKDTFRNVKIRGLCCCLFFFLFLVLHLTAFPYYLMSYLLISFCRVLSQVSNSPFRFLFLFLYVLTSSQITQVF